MAVHTLHSQSHNNNIITIRVIRAITGVDCFRMAHVLAHMWL